MGTSRSFNDMLNEYLPLDLLREEFLKRDYFFNKIEKREDWKGGTLVVPFQGAAATSVKFGSLTDATDVSEYDYVRGQITGYPEMWSTLKWNQRDLMEHDGKVKEKSFLKILPDQIDQFMTYLKMVVSNNILNGPHFATVTVNGTIGGVLGVDKIDRFELGQKFTLDDGDSAQVDVYVIAVDVNASTVTVSATRGGAALDVSAYTVAQGAKCFHDGILVGGTATNNFSSLKSALLSASNGGSATLYGQTKLAYPYLQAINISGAAMTASTILDDIFDAFSVVRQKAKGAQTDTVLLSFKHLGSIMKLIETQKGPFNVVPNSMKANKYGWTEITITSVKGALTIVGIQEMDDDVIFLLDFSSMKFFSNGMFRKRTAPDGKQYYEVRATSGYYYLLDISLFGDLVVQKPTSNAVIYGISY